MSDSDGDSTPSVFLSSLASTRFMGNTKAPAGKFATLQRLKEAREQGKNKKINYEVVSESSGCQLSSNNCEILQLKTTSDETFRLAEIVKNLHQNFSFSDFTIRCGAQEFPCHRFVLAGRSPVLATMLEVDMEEAQSGRLSIVDFEPGTVQALVKYIYTGEVTIDMELLPQLVAAADKYQLPGLLDSCLKIFQKPGSACEEIAVDLLIVAEQHNLKDLKRSAIKKISSNKGKLVKSESFKAKLTKFPNLLFELYEN